MRKFVMSCYIPQSLQVQRAPCVTMYTIYKPSPSLKFIFKIQAYFILFYTSSYVKEKDTNIPQSDMNAQNTKTISHPETLVYELDLQQ